MRRQLLALKRFIFPCLIFTRLFAVLMMPTSTTEEKQAKIRDMGALGRWYANALSPNEGLAGVLKPDWVGFHHNSYYASAYTPHVLHNAALIQYLLSGTAFEFSKQHLCHHPLLTTLITLLNSKGAVANSETPYHPVLLNPPPPPPTRNKGILKFHFVKYRRRNRTGRKHCLVHSLLILSCDSV